MTNWWGSGNGSGASSVAYTTLKIAVFGPMPSARAVMAAIEKPRAFISPRTANRRSDHSTLMATLPKQSGGLQVHGQREVH